MDSYVDRDLGTECPSRIPLVYILSSPFTLRSLPFRVSSHPDFILFFLPARWWWRIGRTKEQMGGARRALSSKTGPHHEAPEANARGYLRTRVVLRISGAGEPWASRHAKSRYNKDLLSRPCQQQSYVDEREIRCESVMGSYLKDASSTRNKTQESILESNMSLVHVFHEFLLFLYIQI